MNRKYHVKLSEEECKTIQERMNHERTSTIVRKRCSVLLDADENAGEPPTQEEISIMSDVTVHTVIKEYDTQGIAYCLRERVHRTPPNPPIITGEKETRIAALACGSAPEGRARRTVRLLAEKVVELGIMETVSHETCIMWWHLQAIICNWTGSSNHNHQHNMGVVMISKQNSKITYTFENPNQSKDFEKLLRQMIVEKLLNLHCKIS